MSLLRFLVCESPNPDLSNLRLETTLVTPVISVIALVFYSGSLHIYFMFLYLIVFKNILQLYFK